MKDGKKALAVRTLNRSMANFMVQTGLDKDSLMPALDAMTERMMIRVHFFKRRLGSRTYRIPYQVSEDRAFRHSLKRMYKLIRQKKNVKFHETLTEELRALHEGTNASLIVAEKHRVYREAVEARGLTYLIQGFKLKDDQSVRIDPSIFTPITES